MKVNNNQKLREALENSNGLLEELALMGEWGESAREQITENKNTLSAPPRNCDRFNNADELVAYYGDEGMKEAWRELREKIKNGKHELAIDLVFMIDWLFIKAKGETK